MVKYCVYLAVFWLLSVQVFSKPNSFLSQKDMKNEVKTAIFENRILTVGQIGGLDEYSDGNLLVFHRASTKWERDSFFDDNFNLDKYGVIKNDVLSLVDTNTLTEIDSWGAGRFYMPHGLTVDDNNNIWLTDVALHQVFKYNLKISEEPLLILGTRFKKGDGDKNFCKPTSVAVSKINGDIFVADGYCNNRVVRFDKNGNFIREYKDEISPMIVVHSITLIEEKNLICTVSREDGRIIFFDINSGEKKGEIKNPNMKTVYAVEYDSESQVIHAVTGSNLNLKSYGLTFDARQNNFGSLKQIWQTKNTVLDEAHDIALSRNKKKIYVGQLNREIDIFSYQ